MRTSSSRGFDPLCWALALAALLACADACTQINIGMPPPGTEQWLNVSWAYPQQVMSCRNMGFYIPPALRWDLVSVPASSKLLAMPTSNRTKYFPKPTKHGIVCIGANTQQIGYGLAMNTSDPGAAKDYAGFCTDGMNTAGLSGAYLFDSSNAGYNPEDVPPTTAPPGSRDIVSFMDYVTYILAYCDTIECAERTTHQIQIISPPIANELLALVIGDSFLPTHVTFCDKSARCIVAEWGAPGIPSIYNLTYNTLTNEPQLPEQNALLEEYMAKTNAMYNSSYAPLNWPGGTAGWSFEEKGSGTVEPSARFIRMVMLLQLYGSVPYDNPLDKVTGKPMQPISPAYYGAKAAAFAQINSIMNYALEVASASADYPFWEWPGEISQYISTRDHKSGFYTFRVSYNQVPRRINIAKQTQGSRIKVQVIDEVVDGHKYFEPISW